MTTESITGIKRKCHRGHDALVGVQCKQCRKISDKAFHQALKSASAFRRTQVDKDLKIWARRVAQKCLRIAQEALDAKRGSAARRRPWAKA
jgi:hypothetical protein